MYIMITTRCNALCGHCCFDCKAEGEDMSFEVFEKAMELDGYGCISIGGGEPTLHPQFWKMMAYASAKCDSAWLSTNGLLKTDAIALAKMARKGFVGVRLSQTEFHPDASHEVVTAFTEGKQKIRYGDRDNFDLREVSNQSRVVSAGRGRFIEGASLEDCACSELMVRPNGDVYFCGCLDAPKVGTVFDGIGKEVWDERSEFDCIRGKRKREAEDEIDRERPKPDFEVIQEIRA